MGSRTKPQPHCCKCKKFWDPTKMKHCDKCCGVFALNTVHCCKSKKSWDPAKMKHCDKCYDVFALNIDHCCVCHDFYSHGSNFICECNQIRKKIDEQISDFLNKNNITNNHIVSPCLNHNCESARKFNAGIRKFGFRNFYHLLQNDKNFVLALHGTSEIHRASDICCQSWNIELRGQNGQAYGYGEYFTNKIETAYNYASRGNGAIIISLIIDPSKCTNVKTRLFAEGEKWHIVENTINEAFCLPIAIMQYNNPIDNCNICPRIKYEKNINELIANPPNSLGFQNGDIVKYHPSDLEKIKQNIKKQIWKFEMTAVNGVCYKIDLAKKLQTNMSTGSKREIVFL
jgi:hypothetical protein